MGRKHEVCAVLSEGGRWALSQIESAFTQLADWDGAVFSPIKYSTGMDQENRPVLIGEVEVSGMVPVADNPTHDLDPKSLARLRIVTQSAYRRRNPNAAPLTDRECDTAINDIGPGTAVEDVLRSASVH